jgi:alpha-aminoadipate/glutamate carrier protein LysW
MESALSGAIKRKTRQTKMFIIILAKAFAVKLDLIAYKFFKIDEDFLTKLKDFRRKTKMPTAVCPECSEDVYVDADSEQGRVVTCDECGSSLIVVGLDPIELDLNEESNDEKTDDFDDYDYEDDRY